jgi:uncharacterized BrkB/YihY/UPF0761 family membrane protein
MFWENLTIYCVVAMGLAYVVGLSKISLPIRRVIAVIGEALGGPFRWLVYWLLSLLECPVCFGFWTGFVAAHYSLGPVPGRGWTAVVNGLFTAASNGMLAHLSGLEAARYEREPTEG